MGDLTVSEKNNITSPNGNSLAIFVDGEDGNLKLKDVRGNVKPLSDYIAETTAYLYAYSATTQKIKTDASKIFFENLELNKNINLTDDNIISFNQAGIYNFNLSFQAKGTSESEIYINIKNEDFFSIIDYSQKQYYSTIKNNVFIYNTTLNIIGNQTLSFEIFSNILDNELVNSDNIPSATLTINKIG